MKKLLKTLVDARKRTLVLEHSDIEYDHTLDESYDLQEKGLYIPDGSKSLNIPRGKMPQIETKNIPEFLKFASSEGFSHEKTTMNPRKLKPSQRNFNQDKIAFMMTNKQDKPIMVSSDGYVLDGHHRWLAAWNNKEDLNVIKIQGSVRDIIDLMRKFPQSFTKKIDEEVELNKITSSDRDDKKYMVRVKNDKGNIVTVHFGDPNSTIKTSDPERRKAFRARHNCDNPGPKTSARWWACKLWSTNSVKDHL